MLRSEFYHHHHHNFCYSCLAWTLPFTLNIVLYSMLTHQLSIYYGLEISQKNLYEQLYVKVFILAYPCALLCDFPWPYLMAVSGIKQHLHLNLVFYSEECISKYRDTKSKQSKQQQDRMEQRSWENFYKFYLISLMFLQLHCIRCWSESLTEWGSIEHWHSDITSKRLGKISLWPHKKWIDTRQRKVAL